jgi:exosortase
LDSPGFCKTVRNRSVKSRIALAVLAVVVLAFMKPLSAMMSRTLNDTTYDYIPWIPVVCAYLLYREKSTIFPTDTGCFLPGLLLFPLALVFFLGSKGYFHGLQGNDSDTWITLAFITVVIGTYLFFYGLSGNREALFPLAFLMFIVPPTIALNDSIVTFLQHASADLTYFFLGLTGVPVFREGTSITIPGLSISVARECSGIHSTLALLMMSMLMGHAVLKRAVSMVVLFLLVIPVAIFKNALRITAITLLGSYVSRGFLTGWLHRSGGIVFFMIALGVMALLVLTLRKIESKCAE